MQVFESENTEFKQEYVKDIRKEVVAFANSEGGAVIIGVRKVLLISQFVTNQICSHVTDLPSFVSLAFLCNPADFLPDYLFHLQCYI